MIDTSARLLRLLSLLQSRRFWTGAELAERLEVTERTVRRDMDRLRSLGYPVHATSGVAGGYQLGAGARLPPLLLDDDEALAVSLGLRSAATGTVAGMEETALRALAKLEPILPPGLRRQIAALQSSIVSVPRLGPQVKSEMLTALSSACRDRRCTHFGYRDRRDQHSERKVEPHGLVHTGLRWYLVGWDLHREDFRTFRVDRIAGPLSSGRPFVPRPIPHGDLATYVSHSVGIHPYAFRARVILHAPLQLMAERVPKTVGRLQALDEQRCLLETGANDLSGLGMHIALLGVEFEIESPPELAAHLRALAARLSRAAGSHTEQD